MISIIVTPKDCSKCHTTEFQEMNGSHHAKGWQILASLDNLLGEVVGCPAAVYALVDGTIAAVPGAGGVSPSDTSARFRAKEAENARSWIRNIMSDTFA